MAKPKLLLLLGDTYSSGVIYNSILSNLSDYEISVIVEEGKTDFSKIQRRLKRLGFSTTLGQIAFQSTVPHILKFLSRKRIAQIIKQYNMTYLSLSGCTRIKSLNTKRARNLISQFKPDLILINGTDIIGKNTLTSISCKIINTHVGITPLYRGVHGAYWAIANRDYDNIGTTIHFVDSGIDTGIPIVHVNAVVNQTDNFVTYPLIQLGTSIPYILRVIKVLIENKELSFNLNETNGTSRLFYHPTLFQYITNFILKRVK